MAQILSVPRPKNPEKVKEVKQKGGRPAKVLSLPNQGLSNPKKHEDEQVAAISMLILM